jgi:competence protein ComEC
VCALASLIFAAVWPDEALRPAFLLSIAATAAIVAAPQPALATLREALLAAAKLSLRTSAATAPIVLWTFGSLPLVGVIANLLLVPVGSLLLVLAVVHALVACLLPWLARWTAWPLEHTSRAFLRGCTWFSEIDPQLTLPVLSDAQGVVLVIAVCILLFGSPRWRTYGLTLTALVLTLAIAEWQLRRVEQPHGLVRASFLDVGQGDSTWLDLPDGRGMLIDAGGNPQGGPDPGARAIVPLLQARRRSHIDIVVLSHPHPDHYGGLNAVLDAVSIGEIWDTGQAEAEADASGTARQALEWLRRARARGTRVLGPRELCQHPRAFGEARVDVLWPCPAFDAGHDPNDNSLVLRVTYRQRTLLFSGDIEAHAEAALVASKQPLRAEVLKVPHHGSATSSGTALLDAVAPRFAIVSAGAVNVFGHPHPDVLQRLRRSGARVIELGRSGGAQLSTDGTRWDVETWRSEAAHER